MNKKDIIINKLNNLIKKYDGLLGMKSNKENITLDYSYKLYLYFSKNEVFGKYNSLNHHIEVNVPSLDTSISHFKSILKNINRVDKELSKMNNVSLK